MKRKLFLILALVILMLSRNSVLADNNEKTIIVTLDQMDFKDVEKIINDKLSMGLLNIKTRGKNAESLFMTISTGRKVKIDENIFKDIKKTNNSVKIDDYNKVKNSLDKSYPNFSKQIKTLGKTLNENDIKTSYIGDKSDILMIADENGQIDHWEKHTPYDLTSLKNKTKSMLKLSDVLLISFDLNEDEKNIDLLSSFLDDISQYNIIVFPKTVSGDMNYRLNDGIVPILYGDNNEVGILSSSSTKRESVVSSLDLFPSIVKNYGIDIESNIGNYIEVSKDTDLIEKNRNILLEFLNLNIVKYIIHGFVTLLSLYLAYTAICKKKDIKKVKVLISSIIVSIPVSVLLGILNINRYVLIYVMILILSSILISIYLNRKCTKSLEKISIVTNALILIFIFLNPKYLYDSYIGYNSIVAGGRFYGFNNEIMGILIVTSIISYYYIKDKLRNKNMSNVFMIIYFTVIILSLTGSFGANFGGFLTSIFLFLILIYLSFFNRKINKKTIISLLTIGFLILVSNLYIDMKSDSGSHAGSLIERINILGFYEFVDMITIKLKQLLYMTIIPPWSIGFLAQIYFITSKFKAMKSKKRPIPVEFIVMFITSFIVLLINDTGVVAFVYMNTYLTSKILEE